MDLKKLIFGVSAAALALSAMVIPASADYTVDDTTGAITWTFADMGETSAEPKGSSKTTAYYTFSNTGLSAETDETTAKAATGDTFGLMLVSTNAGGANANISSDGIYTTYSSGLAVYYKAPSAGILSVKGYTKNFYSLQIGGNNNRTSKSDNLYGHNASNPEEVEYSCAANESMVTTFVKYNESAGSSVRGTITEITFTPTYTVADTDVSYATVTVADGTTSAAVAGKTVTITPAANYEFTNAPTVVDASSNPVPVTLNNGSYTFTMPKSDVTVTAAATMISGNRGFTFDIQASEVGGKRLYVKVGDKDETSAAIPDNTHFEGEGTVGIAFIISGIPQGMNVSARIE